MAYVEKYFATWYNYAGVEHEVKLLQDGGAAGTTQLTVLDTVPWRRSSRGGKKAQLENQIFGSEVEFRFNVTDTLITAIDAILESDYKEWKLEHYYNSTLDFVGWLQPDNYSRPEIKTGDYYSIKFSAVDGLANLKNVEFKNFSDGSQYEDRVRIITSIKRALEHVELELNFKVQLGTWCTNDSLMLATDCALDKVTHDSRRFQKQVDGRRVNTNCYKVISELLEPLSCYLKQSQGEYWIINTREDNSYYFPFDWATLTVGTRTASNLKIDITNNEDFTNPGTTQKIRPLETVGATFRDRNVRDNSLTNGDFSSPSTSEWVASSDIHAFLTPAYGPNYELQVVVDVSINGDPANTPSFQSLAQSIIVRGDADQIQVKFKTRIDTITMAASVPSYYAAVRVFCQLRKGTTTGDIIQSGAGAIQLQASDSEYRDYIQYFDITEDDDYYVEFLIDKNTEVAWSDFTKFDIRFDDFEIIAAYSTGEDITFDKYYKVSNDDSNFTDFLDIDIQFGDSASDTDIGAFKIGTTRTGTWSRYGLTDNKSINYLRAIDVLENHAKYKKYQRLIIIDDTDRILPHSILKLGSSNYQIVSETASYGGTMRKELKVELVEILNTAVTVSLEEIGLSSVDGDTSNADPTGGGVENPTPSTPTTIPNLQQVTERGNFTTLSIDAATLKENGVNLASKYQAKSQANFGTETIKTLATGVAASGTNRNLIIAAESGTADDMVELTGLTIGDKVLLRADTGDTITVKHNSGSATIKILLHGDADVILDEQHPIEFILVDTNELAQVYEGGASAVTQSKGTWTVASPSGEPTLTGTFGRYIKTGAMCTVEFQFTVPSNSDPSNVIIETLPFTPVSSPLAVGNATCIDTGVIIEYHQCQVNINDQIDFFATDGNTSTTKWDWTSAATFFVKGLITYFTDEF